jgi:hypothetical protein
LATAAVCSGTSASARGRIDIVTYLTPDADTSHTTTWLILIGRSSHVADHDRRAEN